MWQSFAEEKEEQKTAAVFYYDFVNEIKSEWIRRYLPLIENNINFHLTGAFANVIWSGWLSGFKESFNIVLLVTQLVGIGKTPIDLFPILISSNLLTLVCTRRKVPLVESVHKITLKGLLELYFIPSGLFCFII